MTPTLIGLVAGLLTSIASLPQVFKTWKSHHARDLSIWQPVLLSAGVALWLIYGMLISDIPLILANITPLVCNLLLTAMKIKFSDTGSEHNEEGTCMKRITLYMLGLLLISTLSGCGYNSMQANEEAVTAAWGNVESSYQRRNDLIPNLVEVVKGYAKHEADTLKAVTEARAKVGSMQLSKEVINDPAALTKFQQNQGELSSALSRLMVVAEKYPDLKANQNFLTSRNNWKALKTGLM